MPTAAFFRPAAPPLERRWTWVDVSGPDAADYLQRMTTANVRGLAPGDGRWACVLDPRGRIQGVFRLWRFGAETFGLEVDAGRGDEGTKLAALLERTHFAEKLEISRIDSAQLAVAWAFGPEAAFRGIAPPPGPLSSSPRSWSVEGVRVRFHGELLADEAGGSGEIAWIAAWAPPAMLDAWLDALPVGARAAAPTPDAWKRFRISRLRPERDAEITDEFLPLETGLEATVSEPKGCYPGQEVIERIITQGAPPRRLVRVRRLSGPSLAEGMELAADAGGPSAGRITTASPDSDEALAWVRKLMAKPGLELRASGGAAEATRVVVERVAGG